MRTCNLFNSHLRNIGNQLSSQFLFHNIILYVTKVLETRLFWQFNTVFYAFIIYIVAVFFLLADCWKLLSSKVSIIILESNSLLLGLISLLCCGFTFTCVCVGWLFYSGGLFAYVFPKTSGISSQSIYPLLYHMW